MGEVVDVGHEGGVPGLGGDAYEARELLGHNHKGNGSNEAADQAAAQYILQEAEPGGQEMG